MIELKRDPETGEVVAYEGGKLVGSVTTIGDVLEGSPSEAPDYAGRALGRALGREGQPAALRGAQKSLGEVSGGRPAWRSTE